ncbi:MBL fold metallo-hydrolase [Pasteurella multocida]|uniref:MBL fold metallo-hydrolase n=1 Tax=Pasteurella multocida TaxID=747 RepID=UPI0014614967|nr:MBL fold metallo-hydrolase [Pasteurella multocida]NMR60167.1 MBL fold metallo-hydrolase [Pasteurella multocida]
MKIAIPEIKAFFDEPTNTYSYVVHDPDRQACAIIDSVLDLDYAAGKISTVSADAIIAYIQQQQLTVEWILETHVHADHLSAAPYLQEKLGGKTGIGQHITTVQNVFGKAFNAGTEFARDGSQFNRLFHDGDEFTLGRLPVKVIHTPGHTPACVSYLIGDAVFVGDTLFMPDYGTARCDFPGGDANVLYQSVQKLLALPEETRMFLCHDYLPKHRQEYCYETTVKAQKEQNIHIHHGVKQAEFVQMRQSRDATLSMPKLIIPSVQVNMRAGHLPPAEENGQVYLKVPINLFKS